jgi:hypothetical protein
MNPHIDPVDPFIRTGRIIYVLIARPQAGQCPGEYPDMDLVGKLSHMPELAGLPGIKGPVAYAAGLMTLPGIFKAGAGWCSPVEDQDSDFVLHGSCVCQSGTRQKQDTGNYERENLFSFHDALLF